MSMRRYTARHRVPRGRLTAVVTAAVLVAGGSGTVAVLPVLTDVANAAPVPSAVTDVNPNATPTPLFGGRVEKLAIDPLNPQKLWAATELGGLWRSTNGGNNWSHVDAVPLQRVQDVTVATSDPSLVIAVGSYEGSTVSQGGIWRSTDGGATWSKPANSDPPGPCGSEASALSVAVGAGTPGSLPVYVGDTCGLTRSNSSGAGGTWTRLDPDGAFDNGLGQAHQVEDIDVRPGSGSNIQVDVCGPQGFFRSNDSGGTWSASDAASPTFRPATSAGLTGNAFGPCSVAVDPNNANIVYLSTFEGGTTTGFCAGQLLENRNAGAAGSWTQMGSDVTDSNCRDTFVQAQDNPDANTATYDVYFGTSTRILRQTCNAGNTPSCATGAAAWPRWDSNTPHTDPTSIVFDPSSPTGCPLFHAADGGVFRETSSGCGATPGMAHANTGLHAFDSSQLAGTVFAGHTDLYFGTQDNGTFYTADGGTTYINNGPDTYNIIADQQGSGSASILRRDCFGCSVKRQNPGAAVNIAFTAPPAPWNSDFGLSFAGTQFAPASYALIVRDQPASSATPPNWAVFYTTNAGTNWTQLGNNLPAGPSPGAGSGPGSHGQIKWSGPATSPTFYLTLAGVLYRLTGGVLDNSQATNAATLTNVSTGLAAVTAFDVDTSDPSLLFAVSRDGGQGIYKSINGGASWTKDNAVTSLVTGGGAYKWNSNALGPQARSIGIDPYTDTVLVGTLSNGIFASTNNGASWITVRGSKQIPFVLDYVFDDQRDTIYVGSRGRGLWRVDLPESNLSITKSDSPDPVIAGEQLKYTITVKNNGPDTSSGATVVDDLPSELSYVTSSIPCTATPVAGTPGHDHVECALPDLANGASVTFTITTAVHANAVSLHGGPLTITNTASVASGETVDNDDSDNTASTTTVVNDSADLQVTKLCEATTVKAGQDARCTIYVDNHGPSDARGVVLSDTLTSNGTAFTVANIATPQGGTCAPTAVPGGTRYDCDLGVIEAESTANAGRKTLTYTVSAAEAQEIDNKARARSDTPDPDDTNNITSQTISITAVADLVLTKTAPSSATAGTTFDYVLTVKNNGPSTATNVAISDTVPAGVTILTVAGTGGPASCVAGVPGDPSRPAKCTFGSLPGDGTTTRTMTISVRVDPGTTGILHNDARASSGTFDPDTSNNLAHTDTTVTTSADLAVTKTDSPDPVTAGTANTYVLHVTNAGPSVARNVVTDDTLPGWVTFTGSLIQHGSGSCAQVVGNPNHVICQLGDLAPGDYVDVVLSGFVKSGAPATVVLHNTVTVSSTTPDSVPGNNSAYADSTVVTKADLLIGHTSDALAYKPSTTIHYTITVTNLGPSDAVNVVIKDQLPPAKYGTYVSNDGGCTYAATVLTCPGVTLVAGAGRIVLVNFFVQGTKGTIQATASVTSATFDPNTANNSLTRTVTRK